MRKAFWLVLLLVLPAAVFAQDIPDYTDKYVNDFGGVFSAEQAGELRSLFSGIDTTTTAEVTVLTMTTVSPYAMSDFAQRVFDKWLIGKADKDNGLLILYAKDTQKIWVQTGYGLEGILPDSKIGRILDEAFVPERTAGNVTNGIILAAHAYADVINANAEEVRSGQAGPQAGTSVLPFILIFLLLSIGIPLYFAYNSAHPKCECGGRADAVKTEQKTETKKGPFGFDMTSYYTIVTYKCKKCKKTWTKRKEGSYRRSGAFLLAAGGSGGGGFGGGGFGGGGSGGGGAGR